MTNPDLAAAIRLALLENARVDEVVQVQTVEREGEGAAVVGVRVALNGINHVGDLPPVLGAIRGRVREIAPDAAIFIEPDVFGERKFDVSTEAIVIRSVD